MKKNECKDYIESLSRFLIKNKNMYSQDMSKKLNEKWDRYSICCGNDKLQVEICFMIKGGKNDK